MGHDTGIRPRQEIGKRLGVLLLVVTAYYVAAGLVVQWFRVRAIDFGRVGSLINTLILSLLMGFRNRAAYGRWWEARGLWGQLTNDTRNLAAKCAAFVPADALARSPVAAILATFPEALKRHLRNASFRLRDLPGFEHENFLALCPGFLRQHQRNARGLAGTGRRNQHGSITAGERRGQSRQCGVNRKGLVEFHLISSLPDRRAAA